MDGEKFDAIARLLGSGLSRRRALRAGIAGASVATAGSLGLAALGADLAEAGRKKGKKGKKGKKRCLKSGQRCSSNKQCCSKSDLKCAVPTDGSNSDTYCCGGKGATCGGSNEDGDAVGKKCCANFRCSTSGMDGDPGFVPFTKGTCVRA